jgi:NH3-dependent NAD+ synthetase
MALSNRFGWLVLTTDKSETAVGYCALRRHGWRLAIVPKTLVWALAAT